MPRSFWFIGSIYLLPFFSLLWSDYPHATKMGILAISINIPLVYLSIQAFRARGINVLILFSYAIVLTTFLTALVIILKYGAFRAQNYEMADVVGSISNGAASIALMCLPTLFWAVRYDRKKSKYSYACMALIFFVVIASESRAAIALFLLSIFILLVSMRGSLNKKMLQLCLGSFATIFLVLLVTSVLGWDNTVGKVIHRFESSQILVDLSGNDHSSTKENDYARAKMYIYGAKLIESHWLVGAGYNTLKPFMEDRLGYGLVSHNLIITAWGEMGILGLLGFIFFFGKNFYIFSNFSRVGDPKLKDLAVVAKTTLLIFLIYSMVRPYSSIFSFPVYMAIFYQCLRYKNKSTLV